MTQSVAGRTSACSPFRLGSWFVDPGSNALWRDEREYHLEPKLMGVLTGLVQADGATVSKDELLERVWPRRYVVEGVLKRAVSELRRTLGDDAREPRYIQTVFKVGYRLVATPRACEPGERVINGTAGELARVLQRLAADEYAPLDISLVLRRRGAATLAGVTGQRPAAQDGPAAQ